MPVQLSRCALNGCASALTITLPNLLFLSPPHQLSLPVCATLLLFASSPCRTRGLPSALSREIPNGIPRDAISRDMGSTMAMWACLRGFASLPSAHLRECGVDSSSPLSSPLLGDKGPPPAAGAAAAVLVLRPAQFSAMLAAGSGKGLQVMDGRPSRCINGILAAVATPMCPCCCCCDLPCTLLPGAAVAWPTAHLPLEAASAGVACCAWDRACMPSGQAIMW